MQTAGPATADGRESLIESHLPLVRAVARRYAGRGVELDDLVQAGAVGLVKASDRFDPERGVAFATFAAPTIEGEIRHHLRDHAAPVRVPRRVQQLAAELRRRETELSGDLGRTPTSAELAKAAGVDQEAVAEALSAAATGQPVPLQADLASPGDAQHPAATEPTAATDDRLLLEGRMRVLDERERQIVYLRYHGDLTERQIAAEVGISQSHVSRLLAAALDKLRAAEAETPDIARDNAVSRADMPPPADPDPAKPTHSGRFLVRMPSTLHAQLAEAAERRRVSLNRFVTTTLAEAIADPEPTAPTAPTAPTTPATPTSPATAPAPAGLPAPATPAATAASAAPAAPPDAELSPATPRTLRRLILATSAVIALATVLAIALIVLALERGI